MNWKEYKKQLLKEPEVKREYKALMPEYQLARALIKLRISKGMTQEELATKLNTRQPAVARWESGQMPSLSKMKELISALDADMEIVLRPNNGAKEEYVIPICSHATE